MFSGDEGGGEVEGDEDYGGEQEEEEDDGDVDVLPDFANDAAIQLHAATKVDKANLEKISGELVEIQSR